MNNSVRLCSYTTEQGTLAGSSFSGQAYLDLHNSRSLGKSSLHQIFEIRVFRGMRSITVSGFIVVFEVFFFFSVFKQSQDAFWNVDDFPLIDFLWVCWEWRVLQQDFVLNLGMVAQGAGVALIGGAAWDWNEVILVDTRPLE